MAHAWPAAACTLARSSLRKFGASANAGSAVSTINGSVASAVSGATTGVLTYAQAQELQRVGWATVTRGGGQSFTCTMTAAGLEAAALLVAAGIL